MRAPKKNDAGGRLNDVSLRNVETMEILGSVFNRKGSNSSPVDNNQFYGMECMSSSKHVYEEWILFTVIFKQCLGQCKRSRNSAVLKVLSIDIVQTIVNRNVLNVYHRIFKLIRQSCV